jgi:hypothetical protein
LFVFTSVGCEFVALSGILSENIIIRKGVYIMRYVLLHATNGKYYIARHANEVIHAEVSKEYTPKSGGMAAKDFTDAKFEGPNPWVLLNSQEIVSYDEKTGTFDHIDGQVTMLPMPDYVLDHDNSGKPSETNLSATQQAIADGSGDDVDPAVASAAAAKAQKIADASVTSGTNKYVSNETAAGPGNETPSQAEKDQK